MTLQEACRNYHEGVIRLMIWNVWHLANRTDPPVDVTVALDRRIDICRKTTVYDGRHPAVGLDPPNEAWSELRAINL